MLFFCLGIGPAAHATLSVSITGVTATQAILSYQAPDNTPCSIQVSENQNLAPLVHDVDPALFSGSNLDNRPGNLGANTPSRAVVIGRRSAEQAQDGNNYSRALQAFTKHYFKISCNGDSASGSFTTTNIPVGMTYNDPLPVDPSHPGSYAWPTLQLNDRTKSYVDPQTGALIRPFTTTTDQQSFLWPAGGGGSFCSPTPVTNPAGQSGSFCLYSGSLWFVNSANGDVTPLGTVPVYSYQKGWNGPNQPCISFGFDPDVPAALNCQQPQYGGGDWVLVRAQYQGNYSAFNGDLPLCDSGQSPCVNESLITPRTVKQIVAMGDPTANPTYCGVPQNTMVHWGNNLMLTCTRTGQDSYGWMLVYDITQDKVISMANSLSGTGTMRWCSLHGVGPVTSSWWSITSNDMDGRGSGPGYGPWKSHIVSGALTTALSPCPAGSGISGNQCSTVQVDGEPVETPSSAGDIQSQPLQVGDFAFVDGESMQLVARSGLSWTFWRGYNYDSRGFMASFVQNHATSSPIIPGCGNDSSRGTFFWNWAADPYQQNASSVVIEPYPSSHGTGTGSNTYQTQIRSGWPFPGYSVFNGPVPDVWQKHDPDFIVSLNPTFHNVPHTVGMPNAIESHAGGATDNWFLDGRPNNNFNNASDGQVHNAIGRGGDLYQLTSNAYGGYANAGFTHTLIDPKHLPVMAYCGANVLQDISGPNVSIDGTSSNAYRYCIARKAGECQANSQVGDVFVNCPGVQQPYCAFDGIATTKPNVVDICVANPGAYTFGMTQMGDNQTDFNGTTSRLLTHGFNRYHRQDEFWNTWMVNKNWTMFDVPYPNNQPNSQQIYMLKLPPFPAPDGVARNDFLPVPIPATPPSGVSVDNAVVQFGYAENGPADHFYCTARQEACIEGNQNAGDFNYASDATTGVPCTNGCTIAVPGIPQRMMYFQVLYRDANNQIVAKDGIRAVAVEPPYTISHSGEVVPDPQPVTSSANFIKLDNSTQGNWKGVYGADGYSINSDGTATPAYAQVAITNSASYVWNGATEDPRAPLKGNASDRIASCWYTGTTYTIDLNMTDGTAHQVAIYALDWDGYGGGRNETIEVRDAGTNTVLDSRSVSNFANGQYVVWSISGHVLINVINNNSNAVLSGLFFGEGATASISTPGDTVWVEDTLPAGASPAADGGDNWTWGSSIPSPFSGSLASQSSTISGEHQHYFTGASDTLSINTGDALIAYVYLDPANPPSEVMLQWNDGSWEHRAYWGANLIAWGNDGTASKVSMGALPPTGQWIRLSVPASALGLEGHTLNGMAFTLYGGRANWDHAGKTGDTVWVEDTLPAGANPAGDSGESWTWGNTPTPYSGNLGQMSTITLGEHQHYFTDATETLSINTGDSLMAYVYLDPANPPSEIMLQWNDGSWEHRAYWGANLVNWGLDGTVSKVKMGALPPTGQWVRLSVPASAVGLEGHTLNGMAFTLYDGRAFWDHAGKTSGEATSNVCSSLTLSKTSFYSGAPESSWAVSVTAPNPTCTWAVTSDAPWLIVASNPLGSAGNGNFAIQALTNTGAFRTGHISVGGTVYTVQQEGPHIPQIQTSFVTMDGSQIRAYPNPWRVDQHAGIQVTFDGLPDNSRVRIFTVSGHQVTTLPVINNAAHWRLSHDSGQTVASGIYYYLVQSASGFKKTGKFVVIQ